MVWIWMDFVVQCKTNVQWIATMNLILFITSYNKTHMRIQLAYSLINGLWGLGGLVVYSLDSHGDGTGSILAAAFGYTLVTTDLYGG